jgi:hypothetical protein
MSSAPPSKAEPGRTLAIIGALLMLSPVFSLGFWMHRIGNSIHQISETDGNEMTDLETINNITSGFSKAFDVVLWSLPVALLGIIPFIAATNRFRYRKEWVFWYCIVYGVCGFFLMPPLGVFLVVYGLMHRRELLPLPPGGNASEGRTASPPES